MRADQAADALFSPRTDRQAARRDARALLEQAMGELEHFVSEDGARVNPNRWKPVAARDSLQLLRERDRVSPNSPTRSLLVSGRVAGRVEHALFAAASESLEQLALLNAFIFGDAAANSAVVASLEPPALAYAGDGQPHRDDWLLDACALSIKSLSRRVRAPADADARVQYLEYYGFTRREQSGELVGFYIVAPSGDVASEPAVRCLYRQLNNDVIDVFLLASSDVSRASTISRSSTRSAGGALTGWSSLITSSALFNIANLLECAEAKRLTILMRENRLAELRKKQSDEPDVVAVLESAAAKKKAACGVCQRKKKMFHTFVGCEICSQNVCTRCRLQRRVFVPRFDANGAGTSGGFFQKVATCKPCAVLASTGAAAGASRRQTRALSIMPAHVVEQQQQQPPATSRESLRTSSRSRSKGERFRVLSTSTPRGIHCRMRTESNGSASSMPTPHRSKATPKGGIRLLSYDDDARVRKISSASDNGHWSSTTPRGAGGHGADWKHHEHHRQQQQERFPRFAPGFTTATTPGSTRSKEPMGFAIPADNEFPDAPPVVYASHSLPSTPSSASTHSWSTSASSVASASPSNLMLRMMELRMLAEISYDTTRRNNDIMPQPRRP